jgi:hypothetical protein
VRHCITVAGAVERVLQQCDANCAFHAGMCRVRLAAPLGPSMSRLHKHRVNQPTELQLQQHARMNACCYSRGASSCTRAHGAARTVAAALETAVRVLPWDHAPGMQMLLQFNSWIICAEQQRIVFTCEEASSGEKTADKEIDASAEEKFRVLHQGVCMALLIWRP